MIRAGMLFLCFWRCLRAAYALGEECPRKRKSRRGLPLSERKFLQDYYTREGTLNLVEFWPNYREIAEGVRARAAEKVNGSGWGKRSRNGQAVVGSHTMKKWPQGSKDSALRYKRRVGGRLSEIDSGGVAGLSFRWRSR